MITPENYYIAMQAALGHQSRSGAMITRITTRPQDDGLHHMTRVEFGRGFAEVVWSKASAGQAMPIRTGGLHLPPLDLSDNPTTREVEDRLIETVCVKVFKQPPGWVRKVIEHRMLTDQGSARGGRCAELAASIRREMRSHGRELNWTHALALLGDRHAIQQARETADV